MLKQHLQQKLLQKLSPQQIQFIKLLQVPTVSLDTRIKEELEENPALEDPSLMIAEEPKGEYDDLNDTPEDFDGGSKEENTDEFNVDDYLQDDAGNDYSTSYNNNDDDEEKKETPIAIESTFFESLQEQLDLVPLSDQDFIIGKQIIGSLDDDGYLRRPITSMIDDLAFSQNAMVEEEDVLEMLKVIQSFDPPGIAARDLQECLTLQLRRKDPSNPIIQKAIMIVENYLDEFTRKHYDKLEKSLGLNSEDLKEIIAEILRLNPKPGDSNQVTTKQLQVIPDFHISNNDSVLILTLNSKNAPELRVSRSYIDMFEHYDKAASKDKKLKEAVQFVKQKLDSAKWFIDAIRQRQETLFVTMNAIMHYQEEFFLDGDETKLKPMILKDIADMVGLDISTISRVANSKYVETPYGTKLIKEFFSEAMKNDQGEDVSTLEIKKILKNTIEDEDKKKPLPDDQLAEILKEKGYPIARRTIAKYREQLDIPVARMRKKI